MRAIENGGKTKQIKKTNHPVCCGKETRGSIILARLGLVRKRTKK